MFQYRLNQNATFKISILKNTDQYIIYNQKCNLNKKIITS